MTPAMLPARGGQRDGPRQNDPPAPQPPGRPSRGAAHGPPLLFPPPAPAAGRTPRPGLLHDPDRTRTPEGEAPATNGGLGRRPQAAPPREGSGEPQRDPQTCLPTPPSGLQATGAPTPTPPETEGMIPPPPGRTAAPGREAGAGPAPTPQPPAPAGTTMDKRTRATTPGRHTDRAWGQQASTNRSCMEATPSIARATPRTHALLPAQGRQRDGSRQGHPPPHWPARPHSRGERRTGCHPPFPSTQTPGAGTPQTRRPTPRGAHCPKPGRGGMGPPPPPKKTNQTEHGTGAGHAEGHGPHGTALPAPGTGTARSARATPTRRGGGGGRRESASAHTHKGHVGENRRATGTSPRNAQTAWNGVPASEGKGHPDGTGRHTQRRTREAGRGKQGRHDNRHRPKPPEPAASAAHTRPGHCTRQGSSGAPHHAPAPKLGFLYASQRGSHWRQASSRDPAAPAPRATTHQGGDTVGKRLQLRLLSDALTGVWRNEEAGEGQGSEPREPRGLRHQAGGVS